MAGITHAIVFTIVTAVVHTNWIYTTISGFTEVISMNKEGNNFNEITEKQSIEIMDPSKIITKPEYKNLIPRPTDDEYQMLKKDIVENGIHQPVIINDKNELLDGFTRYQITTESGLTQIPIIRKTFSDSIEEMMFIIRCNLHRRHLTAVQKSTIGLQLMQIEKEKAKQRQKEHGRPAPGKTLRVGSSLSDKGKATERVAKIVGVSEGSMKQRVKINKIQNQIKDNPELSKKLNDKLDEANTGKTSLTDVYRTAKGIEDAGFGPFSFNPDEFILPVKKKVDTITCIHCGKPLQITKSNGHFVVN